MSTIIGYDDDEEYDEGYHGLIAHAMKGFYGVDLKFLITNMQEELGTDCEFVPMHILHNQDIQVPNEVYQGASEVEDDYFIGVIRTQEDHNIVYWVTGRRFGEYPDGRIQILPSGCYKPNGSSMIGEAIRSGLEATLKTL